MKGMRYEEPFYRYIVGNEDLVSFRVKVKQSDIFIKADKELKELAERKLKEIRRQLENYIEEDPAFLHSFSPYPVPPSAPEIVRIMAGASILAGVGPMAAVAGAIAELLGRELLNHCEEVLVENGGDIFIKCKKPRIVGIFAGLGSPITNRLGIKIEPEETPLGICTSSASVGPSFSFGEADAVVVMASSPAVADAFATALGNLVKGDESLEGIWEQVRRTRVLKGVIIAKGGKVALWGTIQLVALAGS